MKFSNFLKRWILSFIDIRRLLGFFLLPRFIFHWVRYQWQSGFSLKFLNTYPCLVDSLNATPFDSHLFYQSAWFARKLYQNNPIEHVDIGSDVRLVASISGFIPTKFIDFRPLSACLPGLTCLAGNVVSLNLPNDSIYSLSCLHVIEHIGLGRYGDALDVNGSNKALNELSRVLAPHGRLYISVPLGVEATYFNAHRVFSPKEIINSLSNLDLISFSLIQDSGEYNSVGDLELASGQEYALGLFEFMKPA